MGTDLCAIKKKIIIILLMLWTARGGEREGMGEGMKEGEVSFTHWALVPVRGCTLSLRPRPLAIRPDAPSTYPAPFIG